MSKLLQNSVLLVLVLTFCLSGINAQTKKNNPVQKPEKWRKLKSEKLIMSISIPANWVEEGFGGSAGSSEEGDFPTTATYTWTSPPNKSGIALNKLEISTEDYKKDFPKPLEELVEDDYLKTLERKNKGEIPIEELSYLTFMFKGVFFLARDKDDKNKVRLHWHTYRNMSGDPQKLSVDVYGSRTNLATLKKIINSIEFETFKVTEKSLEGSD